MKKDQVRGKILNAVISAEVSKGHLKWKVSDIARTTGVSRPLIYYHFGKTKKDILTECIAVIAEEYYGLSPEREQMLREGRALESMLMTRGMFLKNPALVVFYQKWRMQPSPIQTQYFEIEARYQAKLARAYPHLNREQVQAVHAIFHGFITAPFIDDRIIEVGLELVRDIIKRA